MGLFSRREKEYLDYDDLKVKMEEKRVQDIYAKKRQEEKRERIEKIKSNFRSISKQITPSHSSRGRSIIDNVMVRSKPSTGNSNPFYSGSFDKPKTEGRISSADFYIRKR